MKGFPKKISTGQDLHHCLAMVQTGELEAQDLLQAIDAIERREYIEMPILDVSDDRKTVTVIECDMLRSGAKVRNGASTSISAVALNTGDIGALTGGTDALTGGKVLTKGVQALGLEGAVEPDGGDAAEEVTGEPETRRMSVTLTRAIPEGERTLCVLSPVSPYDAIDMTKDQVAAIKEVLKAYETRNG